MATAAAAVEPTKADDAPEAPEPVKSLGKRKLILLAAPVVLAGIVGGLWFGGILPRLLGTHHTDASAETAKPATPIMSTCRR